MPKATINQDETQQFELKTLPDGYIVLRRMSYDAYLQRKDMITQIKLAGRAKKGQENDFAGEMQMMNRKVAVFDFKECIVEHNLEDDDGTLLDFSKPYTLKKLDPRVGQEIGDRIDEMNQFIDDESLGN